MLHTDEPSPAEYAQIKERCRGVFIPSGVRGSLIWGSVALVGLTAVRKLTPLVRRLIAHVYG